MRKFILWTHHIIKFTHMQCNKELPICLTCMCLLCGRIEGNKQIPHRKNPGSSCCESTVLPTDPLLMIPVPEICHCLLQSLQSEIPDHEKTALIYFKDIPQISTKTPHTKASTNFNTNTCFQNVLRKSNSITEWSGIQNNTLESDL